MPENHYLEQTNIKGKRDIKYENWFTILGRLCTYKLEYLLQHGHKVYKAKHDRTVS